MRVFAWISRLGARLPVVIDRRWPIILPLKRFLLAHLRRDEVIVDGHRIVLDSTDSLRLAMGEEHEPEITRLLKHTLRPGDRVVDGGAFIGTHTLTMARAVGVSGQVLAFEPDPDSFALLSRNVSTNGYANVVGVQAALWSAQGAARLYRRDDHHADQRLHDPGDGRPSIEVETITLDGYLEADGRPIRLVKLDLQGSELRALKGMKDTLRSSTGVMLILELWPAGLRACGSDPGDLVTLLEELGFTSQSFSRSNGDLQPVDPRALLRRLDPQTRLGRLRASLRSRDFENLVCVRKVECPNDMLACGS